MEKGTRAAQRGRDQPALTPSEKGEIIEAIRTDPTAQTQLTEAERRVREENANRFFLFRSGQKALKVRVDAARKARLERLQDERFGRRQEFKTNSAARFIDAVGPAGANIPIVEY